eukprot:gnl/MRDRNA2_/MRDRNA2_61345_c0_seq3.p1 gnl/MRDRNA2_/MRDRNA2_61345_c0~~gnl/MRDRNA2_/MRDRNA2_61345_c0_seq3.p1  ORF type:complete len:128 (+),score=17.88 gnl/MRDRNA2_/MRDRNA2_61345_c0_seq3:49-432(+)
MCNERIKPNEINYNAAISSCANGMHPELALQLLEECKTQMVPTVVSYNTSMSSCDKGNQWQRALILLQAMVQDRFLPTETSYSTTISACQKAVSWEFALDLFEVCKTCAKPNIINCGATCSALEKSS